MGHYAQLHGCDNRALTRDVGDYIARGIQLGETVIAIVTWAHRELLSTALSRTIDVARAIEDGALEFIDAEQTLEQFLIRGYPDAERFDSVVGERIREAHTRGARIRAYGEMVGVLWQAGRYPAAIRLEQLWNGLRRRVSFALYCSYPIDVFGSGFDGVAVDALLRAHTHLLPAEAGGSLESAVARAASEVLGEAEASGGQRRGMVASKWGRLPPAESMILWLKTSHPDRAGDVLARAQVYYGDAPA